jgi:hypothetical protein
MGTTSVFSCEPSWFNSRYHQRCTYKYETDMTVRKQGRSSRSSQRQNVGSEQQSTSLERAPRCFDEVLTEPGIAWLEVGEARLWKFPSQYRSNSIRTRPLRTTEEDQEKCDSVSSSVMVILRDLLNMTRMAIYPWCASWDRAWDLSQHRTTKPFHNSWWAAWVSIPAPED